MNLHTPAEKKTFMPIIVMQPLNMLPNANFCFHARRWTRNSNQGWVYKSCERYVVKIIQLVLRSNCAYILLFSELLCGGSCIYRLLGSPSIPLAPRAPSTSHNRRRPHASSSLPPSPLIIVVVVILLLLLYIFIMNNGQNLCAQHIPTSSTSILFFAQSYCRLTNYVLGTIIWFIDHFDLSIFSLGIHFNK